MMTATGTRKKAKECLKGKWKKAALIMFCFSLITSVIAGLDSRLEEQEIISLFLNIVILVISVPISYGLTIIFMKLKRNEEVNTFDFLNFGFAEFLRSWNVALNEILMLLLPIICIILSIVFFAIATVLYRPIGFITTIRNNLTTQNPVFVIISFILIFVSFIYYYVKSLSLCLTKNIAYDNPEMSGYDACKKSQELMKGNKGNYFVLILSLTWWIIILGIIFYCIIMGVILPIILHSSVSDAYAISTLPILIIFAIGIIALVIFSFWYNAYIKMCHLCFYEEVCKKSIDKK